MDGTGYRRIELSDVIANCHMTKKFRSFDPASEKYVCMYKYSGQCKYQGEGMIIDGQNYFRCLNDKDMMEG